MACARQVTTPTTDFAAAAAAALPDSALTKKAPGLQDWLARLNSEDMPILGRTVQEIVSLSEDDDTSIATLAQAALRDTALTAKLLRLANSTYYNPGRNAISTVSRAVLVLGFDVVRSICLSIALLDSLGSGEQRDEVTRVLARSLHAAIQARHIAQDRGDDSPEEVFIAALLYRLGELAFWCFGGEQTEALLEARAEYATDTEAEQAALGFRLKQLTQGLVREWKLNPLLQQTLSGTASEMRARNIELSHRLAVAAEAGWDSDEVSALTRQLAGLSRQSEEALREKLHEGARHAAEIAAYYGAGPAAQNIPLPTREDNTTAPAPLASEAMMANADEEQAAFPEADPGLQLKILRELSTMLGELTDINLLLEVVLEGIYRGIGTDRALFGLLTPDRRQLRAKYVLGHEQAELMERFQIPLSPPNLFSELIARDAPLWFDPAHSTHSLPSGQAALEQRLGKGAFFAAPCAIAGKCIGLFYADRTPSGRSLDQEAYQGFLHFVSQANLGLNHLSQRRN